MNTAQLKDDLLSAFMDFAPSGITSGCIVHDGLDFDGLRDSDNVLAIAITNIKEANIGLPDYFVDVVCILDCRIQQEDAEEKFEKLTEAMTDRIEYLTARGGGISEKFTAPVVGTYQATDIRRSIGADSNVTTANMHLVLSYDK